MPKPSKKRGPTDGDEKTRRAQNALPVTPPLYPFGAFPMTPPIFPNTGISDVPEQGEKDSRGL